MSERKHRPSAIWTYFTRLDNTFGRCNFCVEKISYRSSISNLRRHLYRRHPSIVSAQTYSCFLSEPSIEIKQETEDERHTEDENSDAAINTTDPFSIQMCNSIPVHGLPMSNFMVQENSAPEEGASVLSDSLPQNKLHNSESNNSKIQKLHFLYLKEEHIRRMQIMNSEHEMKAEILALERETARLNNATAKIQHRFLEEKSQVRASSGQLGDLGSGAGKGGGGGGTIREAGGAFGKREASKEEEFFYKQQKEQLKKLKSDLHDEISFHEEQIKRHKEAIERHKKRVKDIDSRDD